MAKKLSLLLENLHLIPKNVQIFLSGKSPAQCPVHQSQHVQYWKINVVFVEVMVMVKMVDMDHYLRLTLDQNLIYVHIISRIHLILFKYPTSWIVLISQIVTIQWTSLSLIIRRFLSLTSSFSSLVNFLRLNIFSCEK